MKRSRSVLLVTFGAFALTLSARPCGPDFPQAVFVLQNGPGGNYASYAAGTLGVPQQQYRTRHMVVAYDYLSGHPLPAAVQQQAVAVNAYLQNPWDADNNAGKSRIGFDAWIAARASFGPVDGYVPNRSLITERSVPGEDYSDFDNCLDNAFSTAASTLASRIAVHTAKDPATVEWVRGQDAVFTNCGDGKTPPYFGPPVKAPAPPPAPRMPATLPASAPAWLKHDRAYQLAAASFYHLDFPNALADFRAIAADRSSPWSVTARYLIARTYIRSATLQPRPQAANAEAAKQSASEALAMAQKELIAMQSEPRMLPMKTAIDGLLDYVDLRAQPGKQAAVLAVRLQSPNPATYRQAVIDMTWLHSDHDYGEGPVPNLNSASDPNDMLAWIDAMYDANETVALNHWRSAHSTAWLLAALSYAQPGDPDAPQLIQAAQSVPKTDPGWLAITYHRLRISKRDAATRDEVLALLPQIKNSGDESTINLFLGLSSATAPSLNDWLASVARVPAGDSSGDGEEALPASPPAVVNTAGRPSAVVEDACGKQFSSATVLPLFDADAAFVFNQEMPLRLLARAAESATLPEGLRFQVAQAAWVRAVLLDKAEIAASMTPLLVGCRIAWKPVLSAYDAAGTPEARHAAGLLALMRFASTVPSVWAGEDRRAGFATYDEFRQNWWCDTVPGFGQTVDSEPDAAKTPADAHIKTPPPPPFLSPSDLAEAHEEVARLAQIPRASTYFAQQALAWQKAHPKDPQTPDILGEAARVTRNACRKDPPYDEHGKTLLNPEDMTLTSNLAKALFETLQHNYPDSAWAKRYTTWE